MRKILWLILFLLAAIPVEATTTVTGTLQNLGTNTVGQSAFVRFWLRGCGGNIPRVNGTAIIAPSQGGVYFVDFTANASGAISGTLYSTRDAAGTGNGDIECGGSKTAVWYGMQVWLNGKAGAEVPVHAKNGVTLDITQATPITTNPVVTAPTGDSTYLRLDAGNSPVTGSVGFTGNNTHSGTETFANIKGGFGNGGPFLVQSTFPTLDGSSNNVPLGPDMLMGSFGAADLHLRTGNNNTPSASTTATTSLTGGGGAQSVTVGSTANFYSLGGCVVEPYTANEEILSSSNCGVSDISHLSITPTKNHTQPYNVSQTGAIRLDSWLVQTYDTDNISALFQVRAIGTGTGANRGFQWGHSSQGLKYFATGKFGQSQDFIPRFYGKSGGSVTSLIYYESSAGTGGVGGFSWRNNDADDTEFLKLDNLGQLFTLAGIFPETAAGTQVGAASLPFNSLYLGTAATNNFKFQPAATAAARTVAMPDPLANVSLGFSYNATNPVYQSKRAVAGCTTGAAAGNSCASDITVTWGTAFADANYSVTCTGSTPTNVPSAPFVVSATKLAATVHINYFAITAAAASYATIDCIAVHD